MSGPKIAQALEMALTTVGAVLRRLGLGKLIEAVNLVLRRGQPWAKHTAT